MTLAQERELADLRQRIRHSDAPTGALTPKEQAEAEAFAPPGTRIYSAFIDIDPPKAPDPDNDSAHNIPDDP